MSSAHLKKFSSVKPAIIEWKNNLPYSTEFNDVYFSTEGGLEESRHVFIKGNQLEKDWGNLEQSQFYLAELGFGSGLNFLATVDSWLNKTAKKNTQHLHYLSIEKRPFKLNDLTRACQLWPELAHIAKELIKNYPSTTYGRHQINFPLWDLSLTLLFMPLENAFDELLQESKLQQDKIKIDHWFLDGFAPAKNKEMWNDTLVSNLISLSKVGTRLATFSVSAAVKKPLINAGFNLEKRKGIGRKREVLSAQLLKLPEPPKQSETVNLKYETPWFNYSTSQASQSIAIIGAGVAGCATAYSLAQKGYRVSLYDSAPDIAQQASGAAAGIFHPQLTNDMNINSQLSWLAYLYLLRFLSNLSSTEKNDLILSQGVERFFPSNIIQAKLKSLAESLNLDFWIQQSSEFSKHKNNLFFPHAGALDIKQFCHILLSKIAPSQKQLFLNTQVKSVEFNNEFWQLKTKHDTQSYSHVVFCGGANSSLQQLFVKNNTHITRGQTCLIESPKHKIKSTLSQKIYLVPIDNTQLIVGSTFEGFIDDQLNIESQKNILQPALKWANQLKLNLPPENKISTMPLKGTLGYRLHSADRMPIIGGVTNQEKLHNDFSNLGQNRILRDNVSFYNTAGLWLNTAYGSHGLLYSLIGSQHLASLISNCISPLNTQIAQALHPARSLIKTLKH